MFGLVIYNHHDWDDEGFALVVSRWLPTPSGKARELSRLPLGWDGGEWGERLGEERCAICGHGESLHHEDGSHTNDGCYSCRDCDGFMSRDEFEAWQDDEAALEAERAGSPAPPPLKRGEGGAGDFDAYAYAKSKVDPHDHAWGYDR